MYLRTGTGTGTAAGAVYSVQCTSRYSCRCSVYCTMYRAPICTPPQLYVSDNNCYRVYGKQGVTGDH